MGRVETLESFALMCHKILKSDRDVNIGVAGFTGEGKTLQKGTKVLMFDGSFKKVEDVLVGDLVMGDDSTHRKVLSLHNGVGELFEVSQVKGDSYVVNKLHLLSLKRTRTNRFRNDNPQKKVYARLDKKGLIKNVSVEDYLNWSKAQKHIWKGYKVKVDFLEKTLNLNPYFLGVWLGDGTSANTDITTMDDEIIQFLYSFAEKLNLKIGLGLKKGTPAFTVRLSKYKKHNNILLDKLRFYNLLKNKHVPKDFKVNSRENRLSLLAGLIDSDGYVNHEGYVFVNKNKRLCEDALFVARSLGFYAYMNSFVNKQYDNIYYKVGISGDCSVIPVKIARKKVKVRTQKKDVLVTGINVRPVGEGEYFGFETDGNNLFLLSDFTVVHNSTFLTKLFQAYNKVSGVKWDFNFMTWSRKELLAWIDGKKGGKVLPSGLIEKQLPEYSAINVDELWLLFYKRNWYDEGQIDSLATLNMCRDRHLLIGGNVPNFWDLDSAFTTRIRFYIYIVRRGVAWVFEQENNPFSVDAWNKNYNRMLFRKIKNPYLIPNFVCEINFPDWLPSEKLKYYEIRNKKRVLAIDGAKSEKIERYGKVKKQRDTMIRMLFNVDVRFRENKAAMKLFAWEKMTNKGIADALDLSVSAIHLIRLGDR